MTRLTIGESEKPGKDAYEDAAKNFRAVARAEIVQTFENRVAITVRLVERKP